MVGNVSGSTTALVTYIYSVPTRVPPTGVTVNNIAYFQGGTNGVTSDSVLTAIGFSQATNSAALISVTQTASTLTGGYGYAIRVNNAAAILYLTGCEL
jgi:hypothetical protein